MATETLTVNDSFILPGDIVASLQGPLYVDFEPSSSGTGTTAAVLTGSKLTLNAVGSLFNLNTFSNFAVTPTTTNGVTTFTLTANSDQLGTLATSTVSFGGATPTTSTGTLNLAGIGLVTGGGSITVCFASGTTIRTDRGPVAVEALAVGDLVATSSGALRPIKWLGHRVYDCRNHPRPQDILPVRIRANAFGDSLPSRDLVVSPGHSICVDVGGEALVPAMALINGKTIVQETVDTVTYWHVELDAHEIIFAEDLPTESYLEMGNRAFFVESGLVALRAEPDAKVVTHDDFCRPYHADGLVVAVVREHLAVRADEPREKVSLAA